MYTINEPTAAGAYKALEAAGREKGVVLVGLHETCSRSSGSSAMSVGNSSSATGSASAAP